MRTGIFISIGIVVMVVLAIVLRFTNVIGPHKLASDTKKEKKKDGKKKDKDIGATTSDISIINTWHVPGKLKEISALCYIDEQHFGAVQDELGIIFIYNISSDKIEKEIPFAGKGDYEGLAIVGKDAFVLRADGTIFEVKNYNNSNPKTIEHKTHLTVKNDPEGFCYDKNNNRLLIAIKGSESNSQNYKGIYAFNLSDMKMLKEPIYKIDLEHKVFDEFKSKDINSVMRPSGITVHPKSGDIYITEGTDPKLLVLDKSGTIKSLKKLSSSDFNQPEGITFDPSRRIFISNEGSKDPGNILEIEL
jgi:uncharacterized protein YjiK